MKAKGQLKRKHTNELSAARILDSHANRRASRFSIGATALPEFLSLPGEEVVEPRKPSDTLELPHGVSVRGEPFPIEPDYPYAVWLNTISHVAGSNAFQLRSQVATQEDKDAWTSVVLYHAYLPRKNEFQLSPYSTYVRASFEGRGHWYPGGSDAGSSAVAMWIGVVVAGYEEQLSSSVLRTLTFDDLVGKKLKPGLPRPSILYNEREMCFSRTGVQNPDDHSAVTIDKFKFIQVGPLTRGTCHLIVVPYFQISAKTNGNIYQEVDFFSQPGFRLKVGNVSVSGPGT